MTTSYLLPLDSPAATLGNAGGKAANLARLAGAGFPIPTGFILTTAAYRAFVVANGLDRLIPRAIATVRLDDPAALEQVSAAIRDRFAVSRIPEDLAALLRAAYVEQPAAAMAVAVRSSATAEDLPDLSFAGQQDSFLNVVGEEALLNAVVQCWSSLWTARAIGYRARNGMPQEDIALAVVVQRMVDARAAGVLFTANPLTGRRTEIAIDAVAGLADALVSGQVTPDHYEVRTRDGQVRERRLAGEIPALPDPVIAELTALGERIQEHFGTPQDIEWAWDGDQVWIVQSRPITSLYPLPEGMDPAGALHVLASIGAFQGVLDPFTPMGRDTLAAFAARIGDYFGYHATHATQKALYTAGERLFLDLTPALRNETGLRIIRGVLSQVEPGIGEAIALLMDDPRLTPAGKGLSPRVKRTLIRFLAPVAPRIVQALLWPDRSRRSAQSAIDRAVADFQRRAETGSTLGDRLDLIQAVADYLRIYLLGRLLPALGPGLACLNILYGLADQTAGGRPMALEILRGLPHNVTTEMDLALWYASRRIAADEAALAAFQRTEAALANAYRCRDLPPAALSALDEFLARYGMRGAAEIDFGRPRWREDPIPVMAALRSYLHITDPSRAPDAVFARGAEASAGAVDRLAAAVRPLPHGWLKAQQVRWAARRVRALAGLRESPKFTIIRLLGIARAGLLVSADELVGAGLLDSREDIFFLGLTELRDLAGTPAAGLSHRIDLRPHVAERRARYAREQHRRQVPRVLLSDGQAFYEGVSMPTHAAPAQATVTPDASTLVGSAVSPGVAEGAVRVVLDPNGAQLQPGEILVCPGTDPSWTPLFLAAGGLVMEVGGMMTHGSVVAREYGIPAVVGVTAVTQRLKTGQRVRVDGSHGVVVVMDGAADQTRFRADIP